MAESFLKNVRTAHTPECIWKNNPCDKSFEVLPMDTNTMKQQLIENIKTWTQTDNNSFYIVPKIDPTAKKLMIKSIEPMNKNKNKNKNKNNNDWINHTLCCNIMLLSGCGWYLSPISPSSFTPYVQCRYCNKCVSLQSYDYKRMLSLLPENFGKPNFNNSFLNAINEDSEDDEEEKEMQIDNDNNNNNNNNNNDNDEDEEMEEDISTILNRELPINDTDSVMHRLSKLGLKIDSNIRRSHNFQIYETKSLQKQAHFNMDDNQSNHSSKSASSISSTLSLSSSPSMFNNNRAFGTSSFGSSSFGSSSFGNNSISMSCSQCMRWPKQSILTQSNSRLMSVSESASQSLPGSQKRNRKRRRNQMSMDPEEEVQECLDLPFENDENQQPKKKQRVSNSFNVNQNNDKNDNENNKNDKDNNEKKKMNRKARKRKTMESDFEDQALMLNKRRRLDSNTNSTVSSVSTTVSLPSSNDNTPNTNNNSNNNNNNKCIKNKKSRKRKFDAVFGNNDDIDNDEESDEDDDIKTENNDKIGDLYPSSRPTKRARLDTPTVRSQIYFDPINLHNQHCPFLLQHKYQQNEVLGWNYCLKLLPKDIMYIKQLIDDQSKKTNQAKSR